MAIDRQGLGLAIRRIVIGAFFVAEGVTKYRWFKLTSLTSGYGLPVIASTLGLAIGGARLPLSVKDT